MAQQKAEGGIPTIEEIKRLDAALRTARGNRKDEREAVDEAVRERIAANSMQSVKCSASIGRVTVRIAGLKLAALVDHGEDDLGPVLVTESASGDLITDDVDPSVLAGVDAVAEAVERVLDAGPTGKTAAWSGAA